MYLWLPEDDEFSISPLNKNHLELFECDSELNQYFQKNAFDNENELISKNYTFIRKSDNFPCSLFTVSNAEIKSSNDLDMVISSNSHYKTYPAVRIGRLATHKKLVNQGIGSKLLFFIKIWFTLNNKTGCRFIVVDSRKNAVGFYKKNGFEDYLEHDPNSKYEILLFDLKAFDLKMKNLLTNQ